MDEPDRLPPVVYGDPDIDALNGIAWRLQVPEMSDAIQLLQQAVVALEWAHVRRTA